MNPRLNMALGRLPVKFALNTMSISTLNMSLLQDGDPARGLWDRKGDEGADVKILLGGFLPGMSPDRVNINEPMASPGVVEFAQGVDSQLGSIRAIVAPKVKLYLASLRPLGYSRKEQS